MLCAQSLDVLSLGTNAAGTESERVILTVQREYQPSVELCVAVGRLPEVRQRRKQTRVAELRH